MRLESKQVKLIRNYSAPGDFSLNLVVSSRKRCEYVHVRSTFPPQTTSFSDFDLEQLSDLNSYAKF